MESFVIGLATVEYDPTDGFSLDTAMFVKPDWTEKDQAQMEQLQKASGAFTKPFLTNFHEDEYPTDGGA